MEEIVDGFEEWRDEEKVMLMLSEACRDGRAGIAIEKNVGEKIFCSWLIKIKFTDVLGSSSDFSRYHDLSVHIPLQCYMGLLP